MERAEIDSAEQESTDPAIEEPTEAAYEAADFEDELAELEREFSELESELESERRSNEQLLNRLEQLERERAGTGIENDGELATTTGPEPAEATDEPVSVVAIVDAPTGPGQASQEEAPEEQHWLWRKWGAKR